MDSNKHETDSKPVLETTDPDLNFFYKPRTLSALTFLIGALVYYSVYSIPTDYVTNVLRGLFACCIAFLLISLLAFRNGPFIRPHPAFWRVVTGVSVLYQLFLIFLLFQRKQDTRIFLHSLDSRIGVPLEEKSYGDKCELTFENVYNQLDLFVIAHTLGWFVKAIILRDYWFCWVLSIMFEVMEYTLAHQLPNFIECWWDHWILDVLICNWLGTYLGMKFCQYFEVKQYSWRGLHEIQTYRGKVKRSVQQLSPSDWTKFSWDFTKSFKNYITVVFLITVNLQLELNTFYLKYLLYIAPEHPVNTYRLAICVLFSIPAVRELYEYVSNPNCKRFGLQAWLLIAIIMTETLIVFKYSSRDEYKEIWPPKSIVYFWCSFITLLIIYPIYKFFIPYMKNKYNKQKKN